MTKVITPEKREVEILTVAPAAQASVAAETVLAGSEMDVRGFTTLAYTIAIAAAENTVTWKVYGANDSGYADEVAVNTADVASGAAGAYTVTPAPYGYYRVKILDKVGGSHGTATLRGIAKH